MLTMKLSGELLPILYRDSKRHWQKSEKKNDSERKKLANNSVEKNLTGPDEHRIRNIFEMGIPGHYLMTSYPGRSKDDRVSNSTPESFIPELTGKNCNLFHYRDDQAPDTDLRELPGGYFPGSHFSGGEIL